MKQYDRVIFFYTLLGITGLLAATFFFPHPYRVIQVLILVPIVLYFWIRVTNPRSITESEWSARLIIVFLSVGVLMLLGYFLQTTANNNRALKKEQMIQESEDQQKIDNLAMEVSDLKEQLGKAEDTISEYQEQENQELAEEDVSSLLDYLGANTSTPAASPKKAIGKVALNSGVSEIDVYKDSNSSSRVVGIITSGTSYPFYESMGEWYLVEYENESEGWVKSNAVRETTN